MEQFVKFIRFLLAGALNTLFGYFSYAVLIIIGCPIWMAVAGSTSLSLIFNFFSYGGIVFGDTSSRRLPKFLLFYLFLGSFNYGCLRFLQGLSVAPLVAQALLLPLLALIGYFGMRRFVFH